MITSMASGALTTEMQDIHGSDVGNSIASHQHLVKSGITMEGSKGIMGKHTFLLYNQLKRDL